MPIYEVGQADTLFSAVMTQLIFILLPFLLIMKWRRSWVCAGCKYAWVESRLLSWL